MAYLTDYKRARGLGSAKSGTAHHWSMVVTSVALLVLIPCFIFTFAPMIGQSHQAVLAYYSRPVPALIAILTFAISFVHFNGGVQVLIEDYVQGLARKILIIVMSCVSYSAVAVAIFAIARIAL